MKKSMLAMSVAAAIGGLGFAGSALAMQAVDTGATAVGGDAVARRPFDRIVGVRVPRPQHGGDRPDRCAGRPGVCRGVLWPCHRRAVDRGPRIGAASSRAYGEGRSRHAAGAAHGAGDGRHAARGGTRRRKDGASLRTVRHIHALRLNLKERSCPLRISPAAPSRTT